MARGENQANQKCSDTDFVQMFESFGPHETARRLKYGNVRAVFLRRQGLEKKLGRQLTPPDHPNNTRHNIQHPNWLKVDVWDGVVLVASDAHYWPGIISPAHRAFVKFCRDLKPKAVIMNGDVLDGASISRHPPIGWERRPTLIQEIETAQERLGEIMSASKGARHIWSLGNHDGRFEVRLATVAPEYARIKGVHLHDHFGGWEPCWASNINGDVVVKHRYKGGIHATHNATLWAGKTVVTGHLHALKVTPFSDYGPRPRWGVDTGTLADIYGPQFTDYCEMNPVNWRSGFAVLTFHKGQLLWPELVHVFDENSVEFRGKIYNV
jgi:predicted phosphodiesterase